MSQTIREALISYPEIQCDLCRIQVFSPKELKGPLLTIVERPEAEWYQGQHTYAIKNGPDFPTLWNQAAAAGWQCVFMPDPPPENHKRKLRICPICVTVHSALEQAVPDPE